MCLFMLSFLDILLVAVVPPALLLLLLLLRLWLRFAHYGETFIFQLLYLLSLEVSRLLV